MGLVVKNPFANAGDIKDADLIPKWGRSPGGGHGNSFQYSCLEKPMDRGDWWATVHGHKELDTSGYACTSTFIYHSIVKEIEAKQDQGTRPNQKFCSCVNDKLLPAISENKGCH